MSLQANNEGSSGSLYGMAITSVTTLGGERVRIQQLQAHCVSIVVYPYGSSADTKAPLLWEYGDTPLGGDVSVSTVTALPDGSVTTVALSFDEVLSSGETSVVATPESPEPPPSGFKLTSPPVTHDIATTASFTGTVRVCLKWTEGQIVNESEVRLLHYEYSQWTDITDATSRDTENNVVCGITSSLSPFTLFDVKYPFTGFFEPVNNLPTLNSVKAGAAVPVRFGLGRDAGLNILAPGYPRVQQIQCQTGARIDAIEETVTAGASSLSYAANTGRNTYVWKTDKAWGEWLS